MRRRVRLAYAGMLITAMAAALGFAAFAARGGPTQALIPLPDVALPETATGRVAAAVFAGELRPEPVPELSTAPDVTLPPPTTTTATTTTTTTTRPLRATTTHTHAPTTTTHTHAPTTTTHTHAPTTTTHTHAPTTTTQPPVEGGARDVEEWRPLVEQYFPPARVEEALRVIQCESKGDPLATNNRTGAAGLFQFVPSTWDWASIRAGWAGASPNDPEANIATAAWLVQNSIDTNHPGGAWGHWTCQP